MSKMSELDAELEEKLRLYYKEIARVINDIADRTGVPAIQILDYVNVEDEVEAELDNHTDES